MTTLKVKMIECFSEIANSSHLLSPPLLDPVSILVVRICLVSLALGDILNRGALAINTIAGACIMVSI